MVVSARAQTGAGARPVKPLYNPMYSPHNYKHPHMAAAARHWESPDRGGVAVMKLKASDVGLANYKRQMPLATTGWQHYPAAYAFYQFGGPELQNSAGQRTYAHSDFMKTIC